jgi:MATE family multidrug resistance protein
MTSIMLRTSLKTEAQEFLKLAIPLAGAQVAQAITGFVDTVMMGWLGQTSLAAGGLAVMVFMTFLLTGTGILSGVSPLVSAAYGGQQFERVGQIARQGLWLALLIGLPGMIIVGHLESLMTGLGQDPTVIMLSGIYLRMIAWGLLPGLGFVALRGVVTSLSLARPIIVIGVTANLLNVLGNYVFAFGKFGLPRMELAGLALSSAIAHWVMFLGLLGYVLWQRSRALRPYALFQRLHRLDLGILGRLLSLGLPIGASTILEHGLFTVITFLMGALGTSVLAAHQLALQTVVVIFMVPLGMSFAATIRVGRWVGQRNWPQVQQAAFVSIGLSATFMAGAAIALIVYAQPIIGLYLNGNDPANQGVVEVGIVLLIVAGFGQIVDGIQRTTNGVLQGMQDTRIPMLLGVVAYWGVGLTSSYFLGFHTSLGGIGVWVGSYIGLSVAAISFVWRFQTLLRKRRSLGE